MVSRMSMVERIQHLSRMAAEAAAETLWPTRCALCDSPGKVLCDRCANKLPYIDWWRACRRCGSPYGYVQCASCNELVLKSMGYTSVPFAGCASSVLYTGDTGQIVRVFKDQGEQRLARDLASAMARTIPPVWEFDAVTYVPATLAAYRYRGYDHAQLLAEALSEQLKKPCASSLARPKVRDQRGLSGIGRIQNIAGSFSVHEGVTLPRRVLLIDDVMTTGATLFAASSELLRSGVMEVFCATFARV